MQLFPDGIRAQVTTPELGRMCLRPFGAMPGKPHAPIGALCHQTHYALASWLVQGTSNHLGLAGSPPPCPGLPAQGRPGRCRVWPRSPSRCAALGGPHRP